MPVPNVSKQIQPDLEKTEQAQVSAEQEKVEPAEKLVEKEIKQEPVDKSEKPGKAVKPAVKPAVESTPSAEAKDEALLEIENILEEDLEDLYFKLDEKKQAVFKQQGEETAGKIKMMMQKAHVNLFKIIELIMGWLKIIPGVDKFFLEKEAKIKAEKILQMKKQPEEPSQQQAAQGNKID